VIKRAIILNTSEIVITTDGTATFAERFREARTMIIVRVTLFSIIIGLCLSMGMMAGDSVPRSDIDILFPYMGVAAWVFLCAFDIWTTTRMPHWTEAKLREHNTKMIEQAKPKVSVFAPDIRVPPPASTAGITVWEKGTDI
jgi:fatty acid desaturase